MVKSRKSNHFVRPAIGSISLSTRGLFALFFVLMIVGLLPGNALCATFSASVSRSEISINDSVTLTLTLNGSYNTEPDLLALNKDFEIGARSHSSQINVINGHINHSTVWRIGLLPKREGSLTIPSLCCDNVCSMPLTVVVKGQASATDSAPVLLETEVSSPEVIAQSQLIFTIRLLMRQPLSEASLSQLQPQGVETTVKIVPDDLSYNTTQGGHTYQVIERHYILFPQHAGTLQLPPIRLDGTLPISGANGNSAFPPGSDPFDLLGQQGQRIRLHSKTMSVKVIDPATHNPDEPWLPAQKLSISDDWQQQPPTLTVGEAATRTITTSVSALSANTLPELTITAPEGFKTYPDKTVRNDHISSDGIRGEMVQKVAMVPTQAGTFTLPEISMRWWDKTDQHWKTAKVKAVTIKVVPTELANTPPPQAAATPPATTSKTALPAPVTKAPAPQTTAPDQTTAAQSKNLPSEIKPKNQRLSTPLQHNPWVWVTLACVVGWGITILFYRRRQHQPKTRPTEPIPQKSTSEGQDQKVTKRQVIQLAQANQAAETRKALVKWIETLGDEKTSGTQSALKDSHGNKLSIDSFLQLVDEPLRREIRYLERYLFARNCGTDISNGKQQGSQPVAVGEAIWDGTALAEQLQQMDIDQIMKENKTGSRGSTKKDEDLPSFYPQKQ